MVDYLSRVLRSAQLWTEIWVTWNERIWKGVFGFLQFNLVEKPMSQYIKQCVWFIE
jgi:hypothetical protein